MWVFCISMFFFFGLIFNELLFSVVELYKFFCFVVLFLYLVCGVFVNFCFVFVMGLYELSVDVLVLKGVGVFGLDGWMVVKSFLVFMFFFFVFFVEFFLIFLMDMVDVLMLVVVDLGLLFMLLLLLLIGLVFLVFMELWMILV